MNLSKTYPLKGGYKPVFSGISLEIGSGEIFALTGPNGSGKTTLLKILSTLVLPTGGSAEIEGFDIRLHPGRVRGITGFVNGSENGFYQALSVRDNLLFFGRIYGLNSEICSNKVSTLIELLGMAEWSGMPVSKCSSGIRQRAGIARAFLSSPRILLIDELSRSLDEDSKQSVKRYIKEYIKGSGGCALLATHDGSEAGGFADRTGRIEAGLFSEQG